MATVPQYEIGKVKDSAVSGGFQQIQTNSDAFGAGIAQANINQGQAISQMGDQAWQIATVQRDKQDQATLRERDNLFTTRIRELMSDPDGYLSLTGRAAVDAKANVEAQLEAYKKELAKNLDQRILGQYNQFANQRITTAFNSISNHARVQTDAWNNDARTARIAGQIQNVGANYNNPAQIKVELELGIREVDSQLLDVQGIDVKNPKDDDEDAMISMARKEFTTKAHESVIANLLANDRYEGARTYYDDNKTGINSLQHASIENSLRSHTQRGRMLVATDEILSQAPTLEEQLDLAAKLPDEIRIEVESRLKSNAQTTNAIKTNNQNDAKDLVAEYISEGASSKADIDAIDAELWQKLAGGERDRLNELFEARGDKDQLQREQDAFNNAKGHVANGTEVPDATMKAMRGDQLLILEKEIRSMATNEENDAYDEVLVHFANGGTKEDLIEGPRDSEMSQAWKTMSGSQQMLINNNIATAQKVADTANKKITAQSVFMRLEKQSKTNPDEFRLIPLDQYVGILDDADLNALSKAQSSPGGIQMLQSRLDLMKSVMGAMGHDYEDLDNKTSGIEERNIMASVNARLVAFAERNGGREANDQEYTAILLAIRDDVVFRKDTFLTFDFLNPDNELNLNQVKTDDLDRIYVIIDGNEIYAKDIPAADRTAIELGLNRRNIPVTERTIAEIYLLNQK